MVLGSECSVRPFVIWFTAVVWIFMTVMFLFIKLFMTKKTLKIVYKLSSINQLNIFSSSLNYFKIQAVRTRRLFGDIKVFHDLVQEIYFNIFS